MIGQKKYSKLYIRKNVPKYQKMSQKHFKNIPHDLKTKKIFRLGHKCPNLAALIRLRSTKSSSIGLDPTQSNINVLSFFTYYLLLIAVHVDGSTWNFCKEFSLSEFVLGCRYQKLEEISRASVELRIYWGFGWRYRISSVRRASRVGTSSLGS